MSIGDIMTMYINKRDLIKCINNCEPFDKNKIKEKSDNNETKKDM